MLAVPGLDNDVVCYERLNWDTACFLRGEHTARVNLVTFSPNGVPPVVPHNTCGPQSLLGTLKCSPRPGRSR